MTKLFKATEICEEERKRRIIIGAQSNTRFFIRIRRGGTLLRDGSKLEKWTLGVRPTGDGG